MPQQRLIGVLGGISSESTATYCKLLNSFARERLGGSHAARCLVWSFAFGSIAELQHAGRWDELTALTIDAAQRLEHAGADLLLIAANTMHLMADQVAAAIDIPLLHIVDPTVRRVRALGLRRVGLLGTQFVMEMPFFAQRLAAQGIEVLLPGAEDRVAAHRVIFDELVRGQVEPRSIQLYRDLIARLVDQGAEAVILGCTELAMLLEPEDAATAASIPVPLLDTTRLHAEAAIELALA